MLAACSATVTPAPTEPGSSHPAPTPGLPTSSVGPTTEPTAVPVAVGSAVAFWSPTHGIVVGAGADGRAAVWLTRDGGLTWTSGQLDLQPLSEVTVLGTSMAWAMTGCGASASTTGCGIVESRDGGATWEQVSDRDFQAFDFVSSTDGWAVVDAGPNPGLAQHGGVFRSTDGGRTWVEISGRPCSTIGWPVGVSFVSQARGWLGCLGELGAGQGAKGVVETSDGGQTWVVRARVNPPGTSLPDRGSISLSDYLDGISMRSSGSGLAWEGRGGTLRTLDSGRTWQTVPPGGSDAGPVPVDGWTATDLDWELLLWDGNLQGTELWTSHDGGSTWSSVGLVPR